MIKQVNLSDKQEHIEQAARALKSISHPLRLKVLCVLGDEEVCVQDIVDAVGTSQSNISQHLAILRDKGVLVTRKDANRVYYRVGDPRILQLIGKAGLLVKHGCEQRLVVGLGFKALCQGVQNPRITEDYLSQQLGPKALVQPVRSQHCPH